MANMQRMLGALLASRMAGRGRSGGFGDAGILGGLGGMAGGLGGGLGGRRGGGGFGRTASLATLGYLAYQAYNNSRAEAARTSSAPQGGVIPTAGTVGRGPSLGERIGDALNPRRPEAAPEGAELEDAKALLLIRAMVAAANADGEISAEERRRILGKLEEAGADDEDRRLLEREMQAPQSLDALLRDVRDEETALQFYLASRAAVEGESQTHKSYLAFLRDRLRLSDADVAEVEETVA